MNVNGKSVIITGAGGGLGSVMAQLLCKNGASVLILDLDEDKLNRYLAEKDEAVSLLQGWIKKVEDLGGKASGISFFSDLPLFAEYIAGWRIAGRLCLLSKALASPKLFKRWNGIAKELQEARVEAALFSKRLSHSSARIGQRHQAAMLADPARIARLGICS